MQLRESGNNHDNLLSYEHIDGRLHSVTITSRHVATKVSRICCEIKSVDEAHARGTSSDDSLIRVSWMHAESLKKKASDLNLGAQSLVICNSESDTERPHTHNGLMIVNMTETK